MLGLEGYILLAKHCTALSAVELPTRSPGRPEAGCRRYWPSTQPTGPVALAPSRQPQLATVAGDGSPGPVPGRGGRGIVWGTYGDLAWQVSRAAAAGEAHAAARHLMAARVQLVRG